MTRYTAPGAAIAGDRIYYQCARSPTPRQDGGRYRGRLALGWAKVVLIVVGNQTREPSPPADEIAFTEARYECDDYKDRGIVHEGAHRSCRGELRGDATATITNPRPQYGYNKP